MDVRIVLLPDEKGVQLAKDLSARLFIDQHCYFQLDDTHIPHGTLLHFHVETSSFENINSVLENTAKETKAITVTANSVSAGTDEGFIGLTFADETEMVTLRDMIRERLKQFVPAFSPYVQSHITLSRLIVESKMDEALSLFSDFQETPITFTLLALCETAEHGVCTNIISNFPLQS